MSPESTPPNTGGTSQGANDGAPEGAPDVADRVTDEPVVDENTDWEAIDKDEAAPNEVPEGDDTATPSGDDTASPSPDEQRPPAKKPGEEETPPPAKKPGEETPPPGKKPDEEQAPPPPPQETEEQRQERERKAAEEEKQAFAKLTDYYKIPDEMVERMRTEPELVLPELAAKVHTAVFQGMQQWATQIIPQYLAHQRQLDEANSKAKETFYSRWPSLAKHEKEVLQVGKMFGQMNPKATPQERLEKVGQLACAALGITPDPAPNSGKPPAQGAKPGQRKPAASRPMRPANPAGSSAGAPPPGDNIYENMATEFEAEDAGQG